MKKQDIKDEYVKRLESQLLWLEAADNSEETRMRASERAIRDLEWAMRELLTND